MAAIFTEIIQPSSVVKRTTITITNSNIDLVGLTFEDNRYICYATEIYSGLPNGCYELINGNWILLDTTESNSAIKKPGEKFSIYNKYIQYLNYHANSIFEKFADLVNSDNVETMTKYAEDLASSLNSINLSISKTEF